MNSYQSNIGIEQTVARLAQSKRLVISTHSKPDGDAFGAVVALTTALRRRGAEVFACFPPPVPANLQQLAGYDLTRIFDAKQGWPESDLVVIVDTGAWSQVAPLRDVLMPRLDQTLIIDHHVSGDLPAAWRCIDPRAGACCEIIAPIVERLSGEFDAVTAEALFVGIASDTGWFRFSNTRPVTLELAARLLRQGVNHADLYSRLEQAERGQKLKLMIRALDSMRFIANDRAAVMVLKPEDFTATGALPEETERFVDVPQAVQSVQVVAMIVQLPPGADDGGNGDAVRVSFRSKPGTADSPGVNVAAVAGRFGGGGHARAAGAKVPLPLDMVVQQVIAAIDSAVADALGAAPLDSSAKSG